MGSQALSSKTDIEFFQAGKSTSAVMQDDQQQSANILMKQTAGTTHKETAKKSSKSAPNGSHFSFSWRDLARNLYMHDELAVANGDLKKQVTKQEGTNRRNNKPKLCKYLVKTLRGES